MIFRKNSILFLAVINLAPVCAFAYDDNATGWETVCKQAEHVSVPELDRPTVPEKKTLTNCSSRDLYYGLGKPVDPDKARKCAYLEAERDNGEIFSGYAMLATIYANGKGANRNLDLAIKFACKLDMTGAIEDKYRVLHLAELKQKGWKGDDFSICDDITSGFMQGACADIEARFAEAKRTKILAKLVKAWNEKDKAAFKKFEQYFERFVKARVDNEVDLSGTGRAAFQFEEETKLRDDLAISIEKFEKREFPAYTADQLITADKELNDLYSTIQRSKTPSWGTSTKEGIKSTQRTWLKYRDSWVAFAQQKYPDVSADSWRTWLTRNRVAMLKEIL